MRALIILSLLLPSALLWADEKDFPGIEKLMSEEQYQAAGMHKLSPAERKALNQWLIVYTVGEAPTLRQTSEEVRQAETDIQIEAEVRPPFKGWDGKTVFRLDNGQIWKQRLKGRFPYNGNDYRVVIEKNFFGYYRLTHVESGRSIGVTRIK